MEDPVKEIPHVIHLLTHSPPSTQRQTIETYFTPSASFTHPFCRVPSFEGSRSLIWAIYRWYKILSPRITLTVKSVAYDPATLQLYVQIFQIFHIWQIPFYETPVELVTVLKLTRDERSGKYFVSSQNDLYQVDQFVRFVWFGGRVVVWIWQIIATFVCLLGTMVGYPVTLWEERVGWRLSSGQDRWVEGSLDGVSKTLNDSL